MRDPLYRDQAAVDQRFARMLASITRQVDDAQNDVRTLMGRPKRPPALSLRMTAEQIEAYISVAIEDRDREWRAWCASRIQKRLFPLGPIKPEWRMPAANPQPSKKRK